MRAATGTWLAGLSRSLSGSVAWLILLAVVTTTACADGEPVPDEIEAGANSLAVPNAADGALDEPAEPPARRFLPFSMRRSTRAETFPHDPHVEIDCRGCHVSIPEHGPHAALGCAECHRSSAFATVSSMAEDECLSCHHSPEQEIACSRCHGPIEPATGARSMILSVWPTPRSRGLTFDHDLHDPVDCGTCHLGSGELDPQPDCSACHENHHEPEARCMTCHHPPPEDAHPLEAHSGCAGAGCHSAALAEADRRARSVCLVCHQDQEDHRPGGDCAVCHQMGESRSALESGRRARGSIQP